MSIENNIENNIGIWYNISLALDWYIEHKYEYLKTPWIVTGDIINVTYNKDEEKYKLENLDEYLVGSAEQGFVSLLDNGFEFDNNKKYISISPCFRTEPILDEIHLPYFMKVELFRICEEIEYNISCPLITDAFACFNYISEYYKNSKDLDFQIEKVDNNIDILLNGIEIGSYGIRKYKNFIWEYGTGLAEPRFFNTLYKK